MRTYMLAMEDGEDLEVIEVEWPGTYFMPGTVVVYKYDNGPRGERDQGVLIAKPSDTQWWVAWREAEDDWTQIPELTLEDEENLSPYAIAIISREDHDAKEKLEAIKKAVSISYEETKDKPAYDTVSGRPLIMKRERSY